MIRRAEIKDIDRILELLHQVLEVHASARPDVFLSGTTKYTREELVSKLEGDELIYVSVDEDDRVLGYAFCQLKSQPASHTLVPFRSMYIDDLCVDAPCRGQQIGKKLFEHVKEEAKRLGCYEITLNVWAGNDAAERFYEGLGMRTKRREMELILE